jgi:predicted esterase YcpF (UPF0227 family)
MILCLHGFASTGDTSNKCKAIKCEFEDETVLTPTYCTFDPEAASKALSDALESHIEQHPNDDITIIGVSLGGFWARWLAKTSTSCPRLILINPLIHANNLQKRVGENVNFGTGEPFVLTQVKADELSNYEIELDDPETPITVFLNMDDDDLDPSIADDLYSDRADVRRYATGGHRFPQIEEAIPIIRKSMNTLAHYPAGE